MILIDEASLEFTDDLSFHLLVLYRLHADRLMQERIGRESYGRYGMDMEMFQRLEELIVHHLHSFGERVLLMFVSDIL